MPRLSPLGGHWNSALLYDAIRGRQYLLRVTAIRPNSAFLFFKYSYILVLYRTLYIVPSILLSGIDIFTIKGGRRIRAAGCPLYSAPEKVNIFSRGWRRTSHPQETPSEIPCRLGIPERGGFRGIDIVGAVPLKNRTRSYAGRGMPQDYAHRVVTKTQAKFVQSNSPRSTKELNSVSENNPRKSFRPKV